MITIFGTPAGTVEVRGCRGGGSFDAYDPDAGGMLLWKGILRGLDEQEVRIVGLHDGDWVFGIGQTDEDTPIPDWAITVSTRYEVDDDDTALPKHGPRLTPLPVTVQLEVLADTQVELVEVRSAGRRKHPPKN